MNLVSKDFFIVIKRDQAAQKEIIYNLNFFYLRTLKKHKKQSFSFISVPFFRGIIILGLDFRDKMRVLKFDKILKDGELKPIDPNLFKQFLFSPNNKYIAFSKKAPLRDREPFLEMLQSFQFDKEKIIKLIFCNSCLNNNQFKILDKGHQIQSFNNQIICSSCAEKIVFRRAQAMGLISSERISGRLKNFFRHLLLKFKDIQKVLKSFKPGFNPIQNKENKNITLYDIEKTTPINKKYLNYYVKDLDLGDAFKALLNNLGISKLLPIQAMSIEAGLLYQNQNQVIMAPTSGGKTLVGEMAGISKLLKDPKKKMLYLVPIVALANIRYSEFKEKYKVLDLKVMKKVGESLLEKEDHIKLKDLRNSNIIVGTYEALDYLLRSGKKDSLGKISTIIIDEIQTLIDQERGFVLDGLIARLKMIYPQAQYLYLSATIGEPKVLAEKLGSQLIRYTNRPVPVERHLILCQNENVKITHIRTLIRSAFSNKSKFGFRGQSIIFTNARKKCESITNNLRKNGIMVKAYHSGLTNSERKVIESEFQSQKIAGVVATAALAAGVDLPASQVIFESLAMGIEWLTVADFEQMLGRAGRLKKHEVGRAYLLVQPEKVYSPAMERSEEEISIKLLNGEIKDFELTPNEDRSLTELLAFISMYQEGCSRTVIFEFHSRLINGNYKLASFIKKLEKKDLIKNHDDNNLKTTELGRAIAKSFFTIEKCFEIIEAIKDRSQDFMDTVLDLKPLKNVYLSRAVVAQLAKNVNMRYFSNNFFSSSVLSLMDAEYVKKKKRYSRGFIELVLKWTNDIFNCSCKENPYCECGRLNLESIVLNLRTDKGFSVSQIHNYLREYYKILIFRGDLIDYFENLIYSLESVKNLISSFKNLEKTYQKELERIPILMEKIKGSY